MVKAVIFGSIIISEKVKKDIVEKYNPAAKAIGAEEVEVVCFSSPVYGDIEGSVPNIPFEQVIYELKNGGADILIIPKENAIGQFDFPWILSEQGILLDNVYYADRLGKMDTSDQTEILNYLTPFLDTKYLGYLEYHVADHCNLNCKACEHYSALVDGEVFTDYNQFEKDLYKLHEFIDDIGLIRILGGEPLLHKDIIKFIELTRKLYPYAMIHVVTNGLKVMTMDDEFYQALLDNYAQFHISFYLPLKDKMPEIEAFLNNKGIPYILSPLNTEFGKKQLIDAQNDEDTIKAFCNCQQKKCNNLYDGKIAACFLPFTTKYFNRYFEKNLPEDGGISLYEPGLTTHTLKEQLLLPFERCRYCSSETEMIPWDVAHKPSILDDWIRS